MFVGFLDCWEFIAIMAGKTGTGIVMLLISVLSIITLPFTLGLGIIVIFFIITPWSFIDFIVILSGYFRDENGDKITNW